MNLFGEPELGIDYIIRYEGKKTRYHYAGRCSGCEKEGFFRKRGCKQQYCDNTCRAKHQSKWMRGSKHPNWKGGITSKIELLRKSQNYLYWRAQIFARDDYTCQDCNDNSGGNLEAHHLITVSENQDLMFDVDNGRTLCIPCHKLTFTHEIEYREAI